MKGIPTRISESPKLIIKKIKMGKNSVIFYNTKRFGKE